MISVRFLDGVTPIPANAGLAELIHAWIIVCRSGPSFFSVRLLGPTCFTIFISSEFLFQSSYGSEQDRSYAQRLVMMTANMFPSAESFKTLDTSFLPLVALALVAVGALYMIFVYRVHPLSHIPSIHWSAPLTNGYLLYLLYSGSRRVVLYDAHTGRQGLSQSLPVLRVGPKEVSIMSSEGIRLVHGGGFERSSWYEVFKNFKLVRFLTAIGDEIPLGSANRFAAQLGKRICSLSSQAEPIVHVVGYMR